VKNHFADTSDTLCYATNENQTSTIHALDTETDLAFVVGGYNSSNTSHLVELSENKVKTFFIKDESEIKSINEIHHFNWHEKKMEVTTGWFPDKNRQIKIMMNSGASCPDSTMDGVILKLLGFFEKVRSVDEVLSSIEK
jgi:4-hydroxy-3-methylbut-2-en-1-yl diphosphate reductase